MRKWRTLIFSALLMAFGVPALAPVVNAAPVHAHHHRRHHRRRK